MEPSNYYQLMARYNQWMNQKIFSICSEIPDDIRKKDLGAFFKSIHGTLNHILYGDKAWMGRFTDNPFQIKVIGQELYDDFDDLLKERAATDIAILEWIKDISPEWLGSPFEFTSNVDGKTRVLPAWVLVTHMFNHQTHHRGQLTTLMKQVGYDPGITDIPWLPDFQERNKTIQF